MVTNKRIRIALAEKGLRQYDLARLLGITESRCSVMLRKELSDEKTAEILDLIKGVQND